MSSTLTPDQLAAINRVNVAFTYLNYVNARLSPSVVSEQCPLPELVSREDQALHAALDLIEDVITGRVNSIAKVAEPPAQVSKDAAVHCTA